MDADCPSICWGVFREHKAKSRVISVLPFLVLDPKEAWGMVAHTHCGSLGENAVPTIGSYICTLSP